MLCIASGFFLNFGIRLAVVALLGTSSASAAQLINFAFDDLGPTVYSNPGQATLDADTFVVKLLRNDGTTLISNTVSPGAWAGVQSFTRTYFSYTGDGTSALRIRLESGNTQTCFAGAINDMAFWNSSPSTYGLILGCLALAGAAIRRRT